MVHGITYVKQKGMCVVLVMEVVFCLQYVKEGNTLLVPGTGTQRGLTWKMHSLLFPQVAWYHDPFW